MSLILSGNSGSLTVDSTAGITFPNGSNPQAAPSKVLQVVQGSLTGQATTASSTAVTTGLTVSITPLFSTSKILCICQLSVPYIQWNTGTAQGGFALYRNGSNIGQSGSKPLFWEGYINSSSNGGVLQIGGGAFTYLDSPATTSSTTYAVYFYLAQGGGTTNNININSDGQTSYIQLLEIAQ